MSRLIYIAAILDDRSQQKLLSEIRREPLSKEIPEGWTVFCHHMTVEFAGALDYPIDNMGIPISLLVTGLKMDNKGCAVVVEPSPSTESLLMRETQKPHVTVAVAPGVKPVYSNELLASGVEDIRHLNIRLQAYLCQVWSDGAVPQIPGVRYAADKILTSDRTA